MAFPSKKIVIIGAAVLLGIGGWFLASDNSKGERDIFPDEDSFASALFQEKQNDSDNDGLMDWEEALWKTEVDNPDTDGDGTLDGEEIKLGRNPTKAGPDDKMEDPSAVIKENVFGEKDELTKTDLLARDFFASFLELQQSGNLNDQTKLQLAESLVEGIAGEEYPDKYSFSDLKISKNNNKEILKSYGNKIAKIISDTNSMIKEDETVIIQNALKNEDESEFQKLDYIIELYQQASSDILNIETPQDIKKNHLDLINGIYNMSLNLEIVKGTFKDPIAGMAGMGQYKAETDRVSKAITGISYYFENKKIIFSIKEDGYIFMR